MRANNLAQETQHNLIQNTIVATAVGQTGIYSDFGLTNATIDSNTFVNNANSSVILSNVGFGGSGNVLSNNVMDNELYLYGQVNGPVITGNTITNSVAGGIVLGGANVGASITNNEVNGVAAGFSAFRLRLDIAGAANSGLTVTNNKFIGGAGAYGVHPDASSYSGTLTLTDNQISGGTAAIQNDDAALAIDASLNYWGTSNALTVSTSIQGAGAANVDFTPLIDFGDTLPGTVGFQADHSSLTVHRLGAQTGVIGRIQEGVNLLADGALIGAARTVNVLGGTYSETVALNKSAMVLGAGTAATIVAGTGTGTGFDITGAIVTLSTIGVQSFSNAVTAGAATTNLSLNDVKLTGNTSGGTLTSVPTVTFAGNNSAETFNISATQFSRAGENPLNYTGVTTLIILGQGGADQFNVLGTASGTNTIVAGGSGNDMFVVSSSANGNGLLTTMAGPIFIDGGAGTNSLVVSEAASTTGDTVTVTNSTIASTVVPFSVTYHATGGNFNNGVLLLTGSAADHVNIQSTAANAPLYAFTGAGNDTIVVSSSSGLLSGIAGFVFVDAGAGANALVVSDAGSTIGSTVDVYNNLIVSSAAPAPIVYQATGGNFSNGVVVLTGSGNDTIFVHSEAAGSITEILTGAGNDTFIVYVTNTSAYNNLILDGGNGFDSLFVSDISGGGVKHIFPSGPGSGFVEMDYAGFPSSFIFFQNTENVN